MFDQEDSELNVVMGVVFGIIALVIAFVIGLAANQLGGKSAAQPVAALGAGEVAFVDVVEVGEPLVKIHFDVGDEAGKVGLGLGDGSGFHVRTFLTWSTTALFWIALTML